MTVSEKISDQNAESIGRPLFDKVIQSFLNEDREELIQHFPYLAGWMTVEIFDEAVKVLNCLGEMYASEYSSHSIKNDNHVLVWKVNYRNDENIVLWNLYLNDTQEDITVKGFEFDR